MCHLQLSAVVDGVYADHSHIAGKFTILSSSRVYVGGSINTRALPGARVHNNFVGCMRKVSDFFCFQFCTCAKINCLTFLFINNGKSFTLDR